MKTKTLRPEVVSIAGKRVVVLEESQYEWLARKADVWEPALPPADSQGNRPAAEYAAVSVARHILRARRRLGLTQVELAERAGVRLQTLRRIEHARHRPNVAIIEKIDRALRQAKGNRATR